MADSSIIEVFPNPHPDRNYLIFHTAHEFTSLCPVTSQPDFARVALRYVAQRTCIELRSLKLYLHSYRNDGIFYEDVTNKILNDLVERCEPRWMELETAWSVRGGIDSVISAQHGDSTVVHRHT